MSERERPRSPVPWARILAESVAIVLSILLAFGIDAWADGRQARERERLILAGLEADFRGSRDEIESVTRNFRRVDSAARELLGLTGPTPRSEVSGRRLDSLVAALIVSDNYEPANATLASLLSSDGLGALTNPELRVALSRWSQQLEAVHNREEFVIHHVRFQLMPFLHQHAPVRTLDALSAPAVGGEPSEFPLDSQELLSSLEFENLVNERMFTSSRLLTELEELRAETERVLEMLAAERDR